MTAAGTHISVVITTWNNCDRLRRTLEAMTTLRPAPPIRWELILVNNNCSDDTDDVARSFATKLPLRYLTEPTPGASNGRNTGVRAASGDLIIPTDDDVIPCTDWLDRYWEAYQSKPPNYFFGGPVNSDFEGPPPPPRLLEIAPPCVRGFGLGPVAREARAAEPFVGPNWACPAADLRAVGAFDPARGLNPTSRRVRVGEETELMERLRQRGLKGWYVPRARVRHFVPKRKMTLTHILERLETSGYEVGVKDQRSQPNMTAALRTKLRADALRCRCKTLGGRLLNRTAYGSHARLAFIRGRLRGFHDAGV